MSKRKSAKHRIVRDPMGWINNAMMMDQAQQRDISLKVELAMVTMRTNGDRDAWATLADFCNMALLLAEDGIGSNIVADIKLAQAALFRCQQRHTATGSWAFDGEGLQAVSAALYLHAQQIAAANAGQLIRAVRGVQGRVQAGEIFQTTTRRST